MSRKDLTFTVTIPMPALARPTLAGVGGLVRALPGRVWRVVLACQERAESRAILRTMDARMRRDMGITHEEAMQEAGKPFWRR